MAVLRQRPETGKTFKNSYKVVTFTNKKVKTQIEQVLIFLSIKRERENSSQSFANSYMAFKNQDFLLQSHYATLKDL